MKKALKKLGHNFVEMAQSHNRRREMEKHLSKPLNNWMKDLDNNEKNDNEHLYGLGGKKVKFRTRKKRVLATGMKEWIEGESQKGVSDKARSIAREIPKRTQNQVEMPAETPEVKPTNRSVCPVVNLNLANSPVLVVISHNEILRSIVLAAIIL